MTAFTWYGNQSEADACRFGALAVVFPLIERMKVVEIINQHLPPMNKPSSTTGPS